MSVKVVIYGASDDLVEVEGAIEGADEYNTYGPWTGRLVAPDGGALIVRAEFSKPDSEADWQLSVENTSTYTPTGQSDSARGQIVRATLRSSSKCPDGTYLVEVKS